MTDLNVNPRVWPTCSKCDTDYVLRRCHTWNTTTGETAHGWYWQRDCNCKKAEPKITEADPA